MSKGKVSPLRTATPGGPTLEQVWMTAFSAAGQTRIVLALARAMDGITGGDCPVDDPEDREHLAMAVGEVLVRKAGEACAAVAGLERAINALYDASKTDPKAVA